MKVIVIGASTGGLLTAYRLGKGGHEVIVFDVKSYDGLGYDWHDYVWADFFDLLGFGEIDIEIFRKNNMSFDIYGYDKIVRLEQDEQDREYAVGRKELSRFLYKKADECSKIFLGKHVDSLIIDEGAVKGVSIGEEKYYADLVVDNSGIFSSFRGQLPDNANIEKETDCKNIMFAYRAAFRKTGADTADDDTKCYLRHLGQEGISWVNIEDGNKIDVLIGRLGRLSLDEAERILLSLRLENKFIGEKLCGGDKIYAIPVRYPATKLFCGGYVMIGDSAFMTVPLLGSGMYPSAIAANILCGVINEGDVSEGNLYRYQQEFYAKIGASFFALDVVKTFLLNFDTKKISILFKSGIVGIKDITDIYNAKPFDYSFKEVLRKGKKGVFHPAILLTMLRLLKKTKKIKGLVGKMPKSYDGKKLSAWQRKVRIFFKL